MPCTEEEGIVNRHHHQHPQQPQPQPPPPSSPPPQRHRVCAALVVIVLAGSIATAATGRAQEPPSAPATPSAPPATAAPSAPIAPAAQASPTAAPGTPLEKLRADLKKAIERANLTPAQQETLDAATSTLRNAATARQSGERVDRDKVKKAFADIKKVAESGAFQPEDVQAVKADMEAMKQAFQQKGGRRRLFRR